MAEENDSKAYQVKEQKRRRKEKKRRREKERGKLAKGKGVKKVISGQKAKNRVRSLYRGNQIRKLRGGMKQRLKT